MNVFCSVIGIGLLALFICLAMTSNPNASWELDGRYEAIQAYKLTNTVPHCPSAESLIERGYNSTYIKCYLKGFRKGIQEINEYIENKNQIVSD